MQGIDCKGKTYKLITTDTDTLYSVATLERAIKRILHSTEQGFLITKKPNGRVHIEATSLGKYYKQLSHQPSLSIFIESNKNLPHPHVRLLLSTLEKEEWPGLPIKQVLSDGCIAAEHFNRMLDKLRKQAQGSMIQREVRDWESMATENYAGAVEYVNSLFKRHDRILVIRLDLGYRIECARRFDAYACKADLERFLTNRRSNQLFKGWLGYIWKMEAGAQKGYHFHCILMFDGRKRQRDHWLGNELGEYWRQLTKGEGCSCNANIDAERKWGDSSYAVGMILRADTSKREKLGRYVISYLTKVDQHLRPSLPEGVKNFRTFGRGLN